jgi:hypothetical protein
MKELPFPPDARQGARAVEVLRAWVVNGGLQCSIQPDAWSDPAAWGIVLADVARHIANAVEEAGGASAAETLTRIRSGLHAELDIPTDKPSGHFLDEE